MKALQANISSLTQKITYLEQDTNRLKQSNQNDLIQIDKYQQQINHFLINNSKTINPLLLKISHKNEELINSYIAKYQSIMQTKENLITLSSSLPASSIEKTSNINIINSLKATIARIDREISMQRKQLQREDKHIVKHYIIEPYKESLDQMTDLLMHNVLSAKFQQRSTKQNIMTIDALKQYDLVNKELKELKESKGIKKEANRSASIDIVHNTMDLMDNTMNESIGSIDYKCCDNIESPRFLTKVKQSSKIDFAFEKKLSFSCFNRPISLGPKGRKFQGNIMIPPMHSKKKTTGVIGGIDNKQSSKSTNWKNTLSIEHKPMTIEKEMIQTQEAIKEMMKKLSEELYQNRVLIAKKNEAMAKVDKINKKIGNMGRIVKQLELIANGNDNKGNSSTEINGDNNDKTVDYEGIGLRNGNLFPTPLLV